MSDIYKERFTAFCEGLELQHIDEFVEMTPEQCRQGGEFFMQMVKAAVAVSVGDKVTVLQYKFKNGEIDEETYVKHLLELAKFADEYNLIK